MRSQTTGTLKSQRQGRYTESLSKTERLGTERLLREMYAARVRGDFYGMCQSFSIDARFEIAGASQTSPISVTAVGIDEIRPVLAVMIRTFKLTEQTILSMIIEGPNAAVRWRAKVQSRITGRTALTELVDIVEVRDGRVASYTEFFAPRADPNNQV
jgi:ketosteroid isomerase-like protein